MLKEYDIVLLAYEKEEKITIKQELNNIKENLDNNSKFKIAVIIDLKEEYQQRKLNCYKKTGQNQLH